MSSFLQAKGSSRRARPGGGGGRATGQAMYTTNTTTEPLVWLEEVDRLQVPESTALLCDWQAGGPAGQALRGRAAGPWEQAAAACLLAAPAAGGVQAAEGAAEAPAAAAEGVLDISARLDTMGMGLRADSGSQHMFTSTRDLAKRWQGETDTELAPSGVQQAEATAELLYSRLRGDDGAAAPRACRVLCSDLRRARHTAEIYAARLGCDVEVEPKLREPSLGRFEGMVRDDIYAEHAELFARLAAMEQSARLREPYFEGLESPLDTSRRVEAVAARVYADALAAEGLGRGQAVFLVSHSKVLEAVLAVVFGKFYEGIETTPCGFFHWRYCPGRHELGELHSVACSGHLVQQ
ncbi:unnamed protein product [Prorocentrum cordatum]|uniref:Uncharacterized protein n=1 Tax=Prorocentrum cordatum TaxID=2364126 RepID=A0ABN9Y2Y8_9DINO|nr:unnamed protein product [Polarella glacialis]